MLCDRNDKEAPDLAAYKRRGTIPKKEQCEPCDGLGLVRWRHSHYGKDWMTCWYCDGTGRKKEVKEIKKNVRDPKLD
jgi:DnaJ-class molecular chaperone